MLPIVQVINNNKPRWFGHVVRREEDSTLMVVTKMKGTLETKSKTKGPFKCYVMQMGVGGVKFSKKSITKV